MVKSFTIGRPKPYLCDIFVLNVQNLNVANQQWTVKFRETCGLLLIKS